MSQANALARSRHEATSLPLDAIQSWWLLAAGVLAFLPLVPHLPVPLAAATAAALLLRAGLIGAQKAAPARWLLALAAFAGAVAILAHYRTLLGQNPGVALLALLMALKQIESGARRDGMAVVLLCYFLVLTTFFYSQSIPNAAALLTTVVTATAALGSLVDSRLSPPRLLRLAGLMLVQAMPLLLLLFVLFPRVSGPLWGLPRDAHSALTGLSDTMSPGSIGNLSQSDAIAFRARFAGPPPSREKLYWRGPVLTQFDGLTWRPNRFQMRTRLPYVVDDAVIDYEVTLEAHNRPWLFALELPAALPADSLTTSDYQLLAREPVTQRRRYGVSSRLDLHAGRDETPRLLAQATLLPAGRNPRTLALAQGWRERLGSDAAILDAALGFFKHQGLAYTLEPPLLGVDGVDEFLFDTRRGFCEHFSSAFVVAMRAAGVPARVVTGYQGGELNPIDGYLTVRQLDAHAWAEVWLANQGWTRIDPTAASHPRRIEQNLAAALPAGAPLPLLVRIDWNWLHDLRLRWDAIGNTWNQWILGYDTQRQRDLLSRLGMRSPDWRNMTATLTAASTAVLLALAYWAASQRSRIDPAQALWLRAVARLARRGLPRRAWEGPRDYAQRVADARPEIGEEIQAIAELYGRVRYGNLAGLAALRARVAAFKP